MKNRQEGIFKCLLLPGSLLLSQHIQPDSRSEGEVRTLKSAAKFKRRITFRFNRRLFVVPKVLISLYRDTHFHLFSFPNVGSFCVRLLSVCLSSLFFLSFPRNSSPAICLNFVCCLDIHPYLYLIRYLFAALLSLCI